ncbi:MAG: DUF2971 domain-containing protein, partial [Planctomycetota bacterium]
LAKPIVHQEFQNIIDGHPDRQQIMKRIDSNGGFEAIVDLDSNVWVTGMYKSLPHTGLYITSFCGESKDEYINANGALSQWRGYGQDGGFALVFDTQSLECMLAEEGERFNYPFLQLADVVYSDDEERFKCEFTSLDNLLEFIRAMIKSIPTKVLDSDTQNDTKALAAFLSCISRYKHRGFKEENEVRICAYPAVHDEIFYRPDKDQPKPEKERKLREKNGEYVPYIELFDSLDQDLPIEQIIVGPHQNKEARVSALKVMLQSTNIEVSASDIPFIG